MCQVLFADNLIRWFQFEVHVEIVRIVAAEAIPIGRCVMFVPWENISIKPNLPPTFQIFQGSLSFKLLGLRN